MQEELFFNVLDISGLLHTTKKPRKVRNVAYTNTFPVTGTFPCNTSHTIIMKGVNVMISDVLFTQEHVQRAYVKFNIFLRTVLLLLRNCTLRKEGTSRWDAFVCFSRSVCLRDYPYT